MQAISGLVERRFSTRNGELLIGGASISEIAAVYGTPLFVYDAGILDAAWNALRQALPPQVAICYSIKANPSLKILRHFVAKGAGLEIASAGEYDQALRAGCPPDKIIFAGPGKTDLELERVLKGGIGEVHVESLREAGRLACIAERNRVRVPIALRVNPQGVAEGGAMRMGGRPAPFGLDEECLEEALDTLLGLRPLDFRGIHVYSGTQILDCAILERQYQHGLEIAGRISRRLGRPLQTLDFGGGLGIPYFPHESPLDLAEYGRVFQSLLQAASRDPLLAGMQYLVEPGRFLAGEAGVYVARVQDIKVSRGKKFVIVDGGMHHHLAASGNLGQTIKRNYPIAILNKIGQAAEETVNVVGPLCTPLDTIGRDLLLPSPEIGDLIGVFQSGAYGRSASPLLFLSHAFPPEVWVDRGTHSLIRRRGDMQDYFQDQVVALPES